MKVVLHYAAGPGLARRVAEVERQQGLRVAICPVADRARYRTAMADAEVLWHLLDPVTEAVLEGLPRSASSRRSASESTRSIWTPPGGAAWRSATCRARTRRPSPR